LAAKLLSAFHSQARTAPEIERIRLVQELRVQFDVAGLSNLFPGVPDRQDWWFIIQLFALDRYIGQKAQPIGMPFSAVELWVDSDDESSLLLQLLFSEADQVKHRFTPIEIHQQIAKGGVEVVKSCGFDPAEYSLRLLRVDEYLRIAPEISSEKVTVCTLLDGYRRRSDGRLFALIAGSELLGGHHYVDSWWLDVAHEGCRPLLVLAKHDYR
jgi:hypothetical protein